MQKLSSSTGQKVTMPLLPWLLEACFEGLDAPKTRILKALSKGMQECGLPANTTTKQG
jgi:hypothetical protein